MRSRIIGRAEECGRLEDCLLADTSQLIVVYGRRRVGKTFLINEFFEERLAFRLTGSFNENTSFQLSNFTREISRKSGEKKAEPKDWPEAFEMLRDYLESLPKQEKHVIFFDEMPWLDTERASFMPAFEWFWNDWASTQHHLVFVVCGSATSWMLENFINNKGGLFSRQTCRLYLKPWSLAETEAFLESRGIRWSRYEIAECYMIMGGIPYYLSLLSNKKSMSQNIDFLFFRDRGELWDEFDHLYRTLFTNSANYVKVVEALSRKKGGMSRNELIQATKLPSNGAFTKILNDLIASGFVRISLFYQQKKKDALYQLSDYYTAFYFHFLKDREGHDEHYWQNAIDLPSRRSWTGLTFEQVCKDHIAQIKKKLGIAGVLSDESVWYTNGDAELGISGAQIDLLIHRRDRVIHLCEMKFSIHEYLIDKAYEQTLREKVGAFREITKCRESVFVTMITTYGVARNQHSYLIQSQVTLDDLFSGN